MAINCALWRHEHWKSSRPRCVWEALQLLHIPFHPYILTPCWLHTMHIQSSQIIPFKHRVQSIDLRGVLQAECMAVILLNKRCLIDNLTSNLSGVISRSIRWTLFDHISKINTLKSIILELEPEQCFSWLWRITLTFINPLKEKLP